MKSGVKVKVYITKQKRQTMKPALLAFQNLTESALCAGGVFGLIFHNGRCERRGFGGGENCRANMIGCRSKHHENIIPNFSVSRNSIFSPVHINPIIDNILNSFARGSRLERESRFSISFPIPRDAVRSEIGSNGRPQRVANRNRIAGAINRANGKQLVKSRGTRSQALNSSGALFGRSPDNLGRAGRTVRETRQILIKFAGACRE